MLAAKPLLPLAVVALSLALFSKSMLHNMVPKGNQLGAARPDIESGTNPQSGNPHYNIHSTAVWHVVCGSRWDSDLLSFHRHVCGVWLTLDGDKAPCLGLTRSWVI